MHSFYFDDNLIAVIKNNKKTIIIDVNNIRVINKNIRYILNHNSLFYGSTIEGRKKYIKNNLKKSYKLPYIINKNIILLSIGNIRNNNYLLINLNKIIDYKCINKNVLVRCVNNYIFNTNISKISFENNFINSFKIYNQIKWQKSNNFV